MIKIAVIKVTVLNVTGPDGAHHDGDKSTAALLILRHDELFHEGYGRE